MKFVIRYIVCFLLAIFGTAFVADGWDIPTYSAMAAVPLTIILSFWIDNMVARGFGIFPGLVRPVIGLALAMMAVWMVWDFRELFQFFYSEDWHCTEMGSDSPQCGGGTMGSVLAAFLLSGISIMVAIVIAIALIFGQSYKEIAEASVRRITSGLKEDRDRFWFDEGRDYRVKHLVVSQLEQSGLACRICELRSRLCIEITERT